MFVAVLVSSFSEVGHLFFGCVVPPRPMDPKKDLAVYGYGSVAWKDRMEEWRKKQNERLQVVKHEGGDGGGGDGDDADLPK